jgi:type IV secretory pathway TrbD component
MAQNPIFHPVYKSMNKPLTIWGAERRLFFLAAILDGAPFNFFGSLVGGLMMFGALFMAALWATATDPELLHIVLNSARFRAHYDPAKFDPFQDRTPYRD